MRTIEYIIQPQDDGKTIDRFLRAEGYTSSVITDLKKLDDGVVLNGERAFVIKKLIAGDKLVINIYDNADSQNIVAEDCGFSVVYEDDDYLVYDKPYGVVVHPTKVYQSGTLGNDFMFRSSVCESFSVFRPIYRIDRNTSGLVVIAKNKLSATTSITKEYVCICENQLPLCGTFNSPIALCDGSNIKRCTSHNGQFALTEYARMGYCNGYSVARVIIHTGRTHQIRVHFSSAGFPLVGDSLYGGDTSDINRHALHCKRVCFKHIVSGEYVNIDSQLPDDMSRFIAKNKILLNNY